VEDLQTTAQLSARSRRGMAASVDPRATAAALDALRRGGTAADAAIAANAVLAVTLPNQCGLGGDLFAVVHRPGTVPRVLDAAGRAGSGADADRLRERGLGAIPADDLASVTVPGCVDGWAALHADAGRLPWPDLFEAALDCAQNGFAATPFVAASVSGRPDVATHLDGASDSVLPGQTLRRPATAAVLADVASGGAAAFYGGRFGRALLELGSGQFSADDLTLGQASWVDALSVEAFGATVWTTSAPTAGYLTLGSAWIADHLDLPDRPDGTWAHLLVEAMRQVAHDRPEVLHDGADGAALVAPERLEPRLRRVRRDAVADLDDSYRHGGTTYLTVVDEDRLAVSLIQSNCMSFGSGLVAPGTGVWLHNRGFGFSLRPGDPNELRPGRRPAHTLSPALVTDRDLRLVATLGTRGGDSQPQIVLQLLVRLLALHQDPATALDAGRWIVRNPDDDTSFRTWESRGRVRVVIEENTPPSWRETLRAVGHQVDVEPARSHGFGHAQVIVADGDELVGAADPRSTSGSAVGL
jgi:gamma-glutamyltranspeptidase/glutathione hydrolase